MCGSNRRTLGKIVRRTQNIIASDWEIHVALDNIEIQELIMNVEESSSSDSGDSSDFD